MNLTSVYIIAEIASSHEGDPSNAASLIKLAADSNADAVKLQLFRRESLLSRVHHKYDSFGEIQIEPNDWIDLLGLAASLGVDVIVEAYDEFSLNIAEQSKSVTAYKIPTSDISNMPFLWQVAKKAKPIFLGIGGATPREVDEAVKYLLGRDVSELVLLHGFQNFPTKLEDSNLVWITQLRQKYNLSVGFADHIDANQYEMARILPSMAIGAGATVIEKHITFDREKKGRDHYSALNPNEFKSFVHLMKTVYESMGKVNDELTAAELEYRYLMKRQAVASKKIKPGDLLEPDMVEYKRAGITGLTQREISNYYGYPIKHGKQPDEPLIKEDFV